MIENVMLKEREVARLYLCFFPMLSQNVNAKYGVNKAVKLASNLSFFCSSEQEGDAILGSKLLQNYFSPGLKPKFVAAKSKTRFGTSASKGRLVLLMSQRATFWLLCQFRFVYIYIIKKKRLSLKQKFSKKLGFNDILVKDLNSLIPTKRLDLYGFKPILLIRYFGIVGSHTSPFRF